MEKKIKLLVVACNTSSSVALKFLQKTLPIPVVGVIRPLIRQIASLKKKRIGVLATSATIRTGVYFKELKKTALDCLVFEQACPLIVPLIEKGDFDSLLLQEVVKAYLKPLKTKKIDLLVLGCTHYPLIKPLFESNLGVRVEIIDSAFWCALEVEKQLSKNNLKNMQNQVGTAEFYVSGKTLSFQEIGGKILGKTIEKVLKKDHNFSCIQKSKDEVVHGL